MAMNFKRKKKNPSTLISSYFAYESSYFKPTPCSSFT